MKEIYFTFDDGPSETTPLLLETLRREGIRAAFFVTSRYGCNDLLREIADDGHLLCIHSYTHDYAEIYASEEAYFNDLNKIEQLILDITGFKPMFLRFPGGSDNTVSRRYGGDIMPVLYKKVIEKGYKVFDWNCENGDGIDDENSSENYVSKGIASIKLQGKAVFLSHTRPQDAESIRSLPEIIKWCRENGYAIKRLDEYDGPEVIRLSDKVDFAWR